MAGRGGYQRPSNPAPVSGPGSLSRRTDGGPGQAAQGIKSLPNAGYGESKEFRNIQQGAPMANSKAQPKPAMPKVTGLGAPTERPNEPITSGIPMGPGPGPEALGRQSFADQKLSDLQALADYLPQFERYANTPGSSNMMKSFVKYLRSQTP
jgi:hypothetical protein